jgi:hypothetical protein
MSEERCCSRFEDSTHGQSPQTEPRLAGHITNRTRARTEESPEERDISERPLMRKNMSLPRQLSKGSDAVTPRGI